MLDAVSGTGSLYRYQVGASLVLRPRLAGAGAPVDAERPVYTSGAVAYSPSARQFDHEIDVLLLNYGQLLEQILDLHAAGEVEVDYSYMARAGAEAAGLPSVRLGSDELRMLMSIQASFSYPVQIDYDEE